MKKIFLFVAVSVFSYFSFSQDQRYADSLANALNATTDDSVKVAVLISICQEKWKYAAYAEAKRYADEALAISEKAGYLNGIADANSQIGIVFWYLKDNQKALYYHQKALAIYKQSGNKAGIAHAFNRMGHDYADMHDYPKALKYFQKALQVEEETGNQLGIAKNLNLIGYIYMCLSDYHKALSYYFKTEPLAEALGNKRIKAALGHDIAVVYVKQGKFREALNHATKGLAFALEVGEKHLLDEAYSGLESIYVGMGNYQEAYQARLKYDEIATAYASADHAGKIKQMEMQHAHDKKVVSDSLKMAREKEIAEIRLQEQKIFTYGGLIGISLTILLLFFVYRNYNKQRIANQKLKEAQFRLIRSEKMAAFGVLASRVSHEIQNPLNFVNNFSEISQELLDDMSSPVSNDEKEELAGLLRENLEKIKRHGKRITGIINQLHEHAKKGTAHEFFEETSHE